MSRRSRLPQARRHILVYDEDWEFLERHYGAGAHPARRIGCGPACREIIHIKIQSMRARQLAALDSQFAQEGLGDPEDIEETEAA